MKYISSITRTVYDIDFEKKRNICPECSKNRDKKDAKDLQYYKDTNSGYCFHCEATFFEYKRNEKIIYKTPEQKNNTKLTDKALKWFEGRMISQNTLIEMGVYSDNEYMPQYEKEVEVICFPYMVNEKLVNIKYRAGGKKFKLYSGAELVFYNYDAIQQNEIIITEGEIDALSWYEAGHKNVISVPNGANKNTEYLDNCIDLLSEKDKIYISTDCDEKGIDLRDELIRRIGFDKCYIVNYKGCKDANEYLVKNGSFELSGLLKDAKLKQIDGVIKAENIRSDIVDYFENGAKEGVKINNKYIDDYITWETSRLATVTGVPGSGKSEFVDYLTSRLNLIHGWKCAFFTPENYPLKYHYQKLFEKFIGTGFHKNKSSYVQFDTAFEHINNNFFYIQPEEETSLKYILERAKFLIKQYGIKVLVIDPYNKIEHQYSNSETQYISNFLDKLTHFCKLYDILIFLVAHPQKPPKDNQNKVPTLYDISGSANFYNKTDYGFTVHRNKNEDNVMTNDVDIHWQKIKFKHLGKQGISCTRYNYNNGRFENAELDSINKWDNKNWLTNEENKIEDPLDMLKGAGDGMEENPF